jgi:hypothetical protein
MYRSRKVVGDYHGQRRTAWFPLKEDPSDIHRRLYAVCGRKAPARSTVFNWVRSFSSGKETADRRLSVSGIAARVKNGSVKPSGSCQGDGSDV